MWKKRLILLIWIVLGASTIALLVAAQKSKAHKGLSDIKVEIVDADADHIFIDEKEVTDRFAEMGVVKGTEVASIDTKRLEAGLQQNTWIKKADLFFDNNEVLQVRINEREPIARVFALQGSSFYIDSSGGRLPLSNRFSARVPVFTSFPSASEKLSSPDSALMADVKRIAQFIQQDSFWMAQVSQIDITPSSTFEMMPVLGDQVIELGNADSLPSKFNRLYSFYQQVWAKAGFEKYERIDVQYDGQVVATKRGAAKPFSDSARAMQQLGNGLAQMNRSMRDTSYLAPTTRSSTPVSRPVDQVRRTVTTPKPKPRAVTTDKLKGRAKPSTKKIVNQPKRKPRAELKPPSPKGGRGR